MKGSDKDENPQDFKSESKTRQSPGLLLMPIGCFEFEPQSELPIKGNVVKPWVEETTE